MMLLAQLKMVLDALAPQGWGDYFAAHGLDIGVPVDQLEAELSKELLIDRSVPGFEEFSRSGLRAVEPGLPGLSLLYHALASPSCIAASLKGYPILAQLDVVENYIYSQRKLTLASLRDPVLAVFTYQYRDRRRTTHGRHADIALSRVGVSRVGNHPSRYDPPSRGYDPTPQAGMKGFRALPARYALFIAERRVRGQDGAVMRPSKVDDELVFLFPVHKVFPGDECLFRKGAQSQLVPVAVGRIDFIEAHINEKLARIHDEQGGENDAFVPPHPTVAFDHKAYPFVRDSRTDTTLVRLSNVGSSCEVVPVDNPLVATATQLVGGKSELARFQVPKKRYGRERWNRYWSTLEIEANGNSRAAPEYVNIRHEPKDGRLVDLNQLDEPTFVTKVIEQGEYEAAHFIDNSCDGALTTKPVAGINLPVHAAYSLVTAIDYFPQVDQVEVESWVERQQYVPTGLANVRLMFPQGGPQPMSDGRFTWFEEGIHDVARSFQLPNCNIPHPLQPGRPAFELDDPSNYTVTAIVGHLPGAESDVTLQAARRSVSWLPDAAADYYAPGWDVSQHQHDGRNMMVSYGLGSPFPEDAKLCAALNSYWPAVAPDSSRTYGFRPPQPLRPRRQLFTSIPLTDAELGCHPQHPRVLANEVQSDAGWDGDFGPYIGRDGAASHVYASNPLRADLTKSALDGRAHFAGLNAITTDEYIRRIQALHWCRTEREEWCRRQFGLVFNHTESGWWLVSFEAVPQWELWSSRVAPKLGDELTGPGYIFVFAIVGEREDFEDPPLRVRFPVLHRMEIQLASLDGFLPYSSTAPSPVVVMRKNDEPAETKALLSRAMGHKTLEVKTLLKSVEGTESGTRSASTVLPD